MIPIIHVLCEYPADIENDCYSNNEIKSRFFIIKESRKSGYYYVTGEHIFGNSREMFTLQLTKKGLESYLDTFFLHRITYALITMEEEKLCACPVWNYKEIRRRVSASSLHLLDKPINREIDYNSSIQTYLDIVDNSIYESVAHTDVDVYDNDDDYAEYWCGEDY